MVPFSRCLEGGVEACTRKACTGICVTIVTMTKLCHHIYYTGCTLADGTWIDYGDTYKKDCNTWYVVEDDMTKAAS